MPGCFFWGQVAQQTRIQGERCAIEILIPRVLEKMLNASLWCFEVWRSVGRRIGLSLRRANGKGHDEK
ncbi:MAG: hypothetical protein NXI07_00295 [bacterium]|nr:hypothetical protein [bacterium]